MVLCKSCKKKDKREYADDCFACDKGDQWEAKRHRSPNKPKTNADRIRDMIMHMTDEEMAKFIIAKDCTFGEEYEGYLSALEWLKQESKE